MKDNLCDNKIINQLRKKEMRMKNMNDRDRNVITDSG